MKVNSVKFLAIVIKKISERFLCPNNQQPNYQLRKLLKTACNRNSFSLSFDQHISTLCKRASNQSNVIERIQKYMAFKERKVLLNSFVLSNFNYCPLVWNFCSSKSLKEIEKKKMQQQALRILHNDYLREHTQLQNKSSKTSVEVKRPRSLPLEIFILS